MYVTKKGVMYKTAWWSRWVSEQTLGSFYLHFGKFWNYGSILVFMGGCVTVCVRPKFLHRYFPQQPAKYKIIRNDEKLLTVSLQKNECDVTRVSKTSHLHEYWNDCARYCQISKVQKTFTILARKRLYLVCSVLHQYQILQIVEYKMDPWCDHNCRNVHNCHNQPQLS